MMMNKRRLAIKRCAALSVLLLLHIQLSCDNDVRHDTTSENKGILIINKDELTISNNDNEILEFENINYDSILKISIVDCSNLRDISAVSTFKEITVLEIQNCDSLEDISVLKGNTQLSVLRLIKCPNIDYKKVSELSSLYELYIYDSKHINDCNVFRNFKRLDCLWLENVATEEQAERLRELTDCTTIENFPIQPNSTEENPDMDKQLDQQDADN